MQIPGVTALVTRASSGIDAATAQALAARGTHVLRLARERDRERLAAVSKAVLKDTGAPDILVNNAGAGRRLSVLETSPDELQQMMALPFFAAFNLIREFLPAMKQRGSGRIVNVTSVASRLVWSGATAYTAARCAVDALTKGLRLELAGAAIMSGVERNRRLVLRPGIYYVILVMSTLFP
jgi:NAD(P)-dependent dehydrogenase (short-subunit alcohol dehydrogenase family)